MSGFFGIIALGSPQPSPDLLEAISTILKPRGPDGVEVTTHTNAAFVFTHLRTGPAPQSAQQPCTLNGLTYLIGDVRLDARAQLLDKLNESRPSVPTSATDEELILHAWRLWGEEALPQLLGDFSFALWDSATNQLLCVRDLLGLKPFFYAHSANHFAFSNTLATLRLLPEVSATLDPIFIADFLMQEWCADPERSAYRDIHRVPAGHTLCLGPSSSKLRIRRYTSLPIEDPLFLKNPGNYIDQFRSLLDQAISERIAPGPTAIFMSGGLDSTSIAALAVTSYGARLQRHDLRAYTSVYRPLLADDEDQYANLVAQKFGIPLDVTSPGTSLPYDGLTCLPLPEPCHEPFFHANTLHYRRIAAQSRVVLSGYGGDDILIGQAWPHLLNLLRRKKFASVVSIFGGYILRHRKIPPLRGGFRARFCRWAGRAHPTENLPPWLADDFVQRQDLRARWSMLGKADQSAHPLHPAGYAGLCSTFWASALEQEDPAYTGAPLELRAPFLDQRLLRFLLRLPPVPWCMDKELLRLTMRGLLPDEVRLRPKTGLSADGLQFFSESGKWLPGLTNPAKNLSEFVDMSRLHTSLKHSRDLWFDLRPVSLDLWLKNVENPNPIR
jgi:asparagine synthase (glutamine-hydrolysing)